MGYDGYDAQEYGHDGEPEEKVEPLPEWLDPNQSVEDFMEQEFSKIIGHPLNLGDRCRGA